ncbi:MAG: magnesium chelatase ATPase subunit I [Pseudomonadota bacterium]
MVCRFESAQPGVTVPPYPFSAIVGQDDLKRALILCAIDASIGGVLAFGDRGTGKTTAIRALAALLPPQNVVEGCPYRCDPAAIDPTCPHCSILKSHKSTTRQAPVVTLPLGATEDRVLGALDLERALVKGEMRFEPGLLASANRGFLYVDEVNLLDDHLVDVLLDVAASGRNTVEREGLSIAHAARFVLVGSGNPEEGDLRPQLLDRFGVFVDVRTPVNPKERVQIVRRRDAYERAPKTFCADWKNKDRKLQKQIMEARARLNEIETSDAVLETAAELCITLGSDGLRGELTLQRAARALAAFEGETTVTHEHLRAVARPSLAHRLRKDPLDDSDASARVDRAVSAVFDA